jgi:hypothetical protein
MIMTNILTSHAQITDMTPIPHALCPTPDAERDQRFPWAERVVHGRQVPMITGGFLIKLPEKMKR